MDDIPPDPQRRGPNAMFLLLLVLLIAGLAGWAFLKNPPNRPNPSATALPATVPGAD